MRFPSPQSRAFAEDATRIAREREAPAEVGMLSVHLASAARPLAYLQPATDDSSAFVGLRLTGAITVAVSIAQAMQLRDQLGEVILAHTLGDAA